MLRSRLLRAQHTYQPMIKFLGQRKNVDHSPHAPAPHPAAPREIAADFQSFLAKLQSSSAGASNPSSQPKGQSVHQGAEGQVDRSTEGGRASSPSSSASSSSSSSASSSSSSGSGKPADFEHFWEAPGYYWRPKEMSEREIEAVMSGGATDIRSGP